MTAARWDELQELLATALDQGPVERDRFLDRACEGRPELRRELTELLAASERASPLDGSVATLLEPVPSEPVRPGMEILGRYQILRRLGSGGMGVVYQARDLRLERALALKFLPAHLSAHADAKKRLRVEAQAAAALDHPSICTIHEIGETSDGQLFIAMAYYPGETIEARLARGAMPPHEAIGVAIQAAQGLAKAHEHGVVHRDIKPANLMMTTEGALKLLDFGIAKVPGVHASVPGRRLGTVAYMSPEQVRGEALDGRTDVWSLGVVLYEMLTGRRLFPGRNLAAQLRAIADYRSPPGRVLPATLPESVDRVLGHMLAERSADRYLAAGLAADLEALRDSLAQLAQPPEVLPDGEQRQVTILAAAVVTPTASRPRSERRNGPISWHGFARRPMTRCAGTAVSSTGSPTGCSRPCSACRSPTKTTPRAPRGRPSSSTGASPRWARRRRARRRCGSAPASTPDRPRSFPRGKLPARIAWPRRSPGWRSSSPAMRRRTRYGPAPTVGARSPDCSTPRSWRRSRHRWPARSSFRSGYSIPRSPAPGSRRRSAPGSPRSAEGSGSCRRCSSR